MKFALISSVLKLFRPLLLYWIMGGLIVGCSLRQDVLTEVLVTPTYQISDDSSNISTPIIGSLLITPSPSPSSQWTPHPTVTPEFTPTTKSLPTSTYTPSPTQTAIIIPPKEDEPQCVHSEFLQEGKVDVSEVEGEPDVFCIVWIDNFDKETGFWIILTYDNPIGGRFIYEVGANVTQLIVPKDHTPRLEESQDQCLTRRAYTVQVIAFGDSGNLGGAQMAITVDCYPFTLPTSTTTMSP